MKIAVPGCAGYIGSVLCDILTQNPGYQVYGFDNFSVGQPDNIAGLIGRRNFHFIKYDVMAMTQHPEIWYKCDAYVLLAALVGAPLCAAYDEGRVYKNNVYWIENLSNHLSSTQRIIFTNTNSAYGKQKEICTELSEVNPLSCYARSKMAAEKIILEKGNAVSLRLATVFGSSVNTRTDLLVNNLVRDAMNLNTITVFEPNARRNFVHIRDVCRAIIHMLNPSLTGIYNVGNDKCNMTKIELIQTIVDTLGSNNTIVIGEDKDYDQRDYIVSSAKLYSSGFQTQYDLIDGIQELKKYYEIKRNENYL